jgi:hypothetical protein
MTRRPRVVVVSGHMVDTPDRPKPRFPPGEVSRVTAEVRRALDRWGVGAGTTVVTGGSRGADIVAAEEARARGADVRLVLALPVDEFEDQSVALAGTDWVTRFQALLDVADVERVEAGPGEDPFEKANARIIEMARSLGPSLRALIVWDGEEGDGPGGTQDFVRRLGLRLNDDRLHLIDPSPMSGGTPT